MNILDVEKLVGELNEIAYGAQENNSVTFEPFTLSANGGEMAIKFLESYSLWDSVDNPTDSIEQVRKLVLADLSKIATPLKQLLSASYTK